MGFFSRFATPTSSVSVASTMIPLMLVPKQVDLSRSAWCVLKAFEDLPESHRPAFDVRAMLEALDLKYGVQVANAHLRVEVFDDLDCSMRYRSVSLGGCTCMWTYDDDGDEEEKYSNTCSMPEYLAIYEEIDLIHQALADRERALEARDRAAVLAGVEYELASVEDLTAALRAERGIIDSVTEELQAPLQTA